MTRLYEWEVATLSDGEPHISPIGVTGDEVRARRRLLEALTSLPDGVPARGHVTLVRKPDGHMVYERFQTFISVERDVNGVIHWLTTPAGTVSVFDPVTSHRVSVIDIRGNAFMASNHRAGANDVRNKLDLCTPNVARMFDYYLGGKDNFAADRHAAEKVLAVAPEIPLAARENRDFLTRAIQFLIEEAGVQQFIDIGPGLPTQSNVHHIAHRFDPYARVAYIDRDPTVLAHGRALLAGNHPGVAMIEGDLREPEKILTDPELCRLIELTHPVALCMTLVLHFIPDYEQPHEIVARLLDGLAPGSYLVISHVTCDARDNDILTAVTETYDHATAPLVLRSRDEVRRFFGECAFVPPGVAYLTQWRRHIAAEPFLSDGGTRWAYAGVARK